jgi:hypothetical protein
MRNVTEQIQTRTSKDRESSFRREDIGRNYLPSKFSRRKANAAIKGVQRKPDMSLEEIGDFLDSVSLD